MTRTRKQGPVQIGLDLSRDRNRELLTNLFEEFDIVEFSGAVPDGTDLCIVDEEAFEQTPDRFADWKTSEGALFAPLVVLSEPTTPDPWQSFDESLLSHVDTILQIPVSKAEFRSRIDNLLKMRKFTRTVEEEQQFLELVFQSSPLAKLVIQADGTIIQANARAGELFNTDPSDLVGRSQGEDDWVAIDGNDSEIPVDELPFARVLATNQPVYGTEYTIRRAESKDIDVSVNAAPVRDASGSITYVIATLEDITLRHIQAAELERQVDLFRQAQQIANVGAWEYDVVADEQWASRGVDQILYIQSSADLSLEQHFQLYHPVDRPIIRDAFERAIDDGEPYDLELRLIRDDGAQRWVRTRAEPQRHNGEVVRVRGTLQDITDRKEREVELQRMSNVVENAPIGIILSDPTAEDNPIMYVNQGFVEMTGYPRDEVVGRNCRFLQGDDTSDVSVTRIREAIEAEEPITITLKNYRKDGSMFWNRLTISPVYDADGSLANFIGFQENVSSLMQQQRQIGILDRYLRHNLRNSLNIIGGHAELIQQEGTPSDAAHAKTIEQASWNLLMNIEKEREITELLRSDLNPTTIELMPLLRAIADRYEQEYPEATISIDGPHSVRVDALPKLSIAFEELVQNAIQHTDHESPSVDITVTADDDVVHVAIADNGPGIPAMEIEVLVNSDVENPTYHGQGFGLWMVYLILEHSGGAVEFQDGEDGGTLVVVKLPPSAPVSD
jgi:PAS domain S-box-containing protein